MREMEARREIWIGICIVHGGSEESDVASSVTSDEFKERVDSGEKSVVRTIEQG